VALNLNVWTGIAYTHTEQATWNLFATVCSRIDEKLALCVAKLAVLLRLLSCTNMISLSVNWDQAGG
jgi:hypothetical protein